MVNKYVILANSNDKKFEIPRQLLEVNGEKLVCRTIRLLKENGVKDIIMTASDDRFKGLGAKIYKPSKSDYDYTNESGYWLNAFPYELMEEPVCFIWGDVYFSENAIKTIVETESNKNLFFCSHNNNSIEYIKDFDEPFAFKVVDADLFKKHIEICKKAKDDGTTCREPIIWEVYRSMHGLNINEHIMTEDYVAINDISCDIDNERDYKKLLNVIGGNNMIKVEVIEEFTLERFNEITNIQRRNKDQYGRLYVGDIFECNKDLAEYLTGGNALKKVVVKVIEVIPKEEKKMNIKPDIKIEETNIEKIIEKTKEIASQKPKKKKTSKK